VELKRVVKQVCPTCGEAFPSLEEVREHWLEVHHVALAPTQSASSSCTGGMGVEGPMGEATVAVATSPAQLIEAEEDGRPAIVRHVDADTGAARTVVMNEDGSQRVFGAETISSMTRRDEGDLALWFAAMTYRHLRGLVHELRERLTEASQRLSNLRTELEQLSRRQHLAFFGLDAKPSDRDLDNAYRRLARSMHPDKNGGTEEAKQSFQDMKLRYDSLKALLAAPMGAGSPSGEEAPGGMQSPAAEPDVEEERKEEQKEDDRPEDEAPSAADPSAAESTGAESAKAAPPEGSGGLEDLGSHAALEKSVWKMLRQLKMLDQNIKIANGDLQRVRTEEAPEATAI